MSTAQCFCDSRTKNKSTHRCDNEFFCLRKLKVTISFEILFQCSIFKFFSTLGIIFTQSIPLAFNSTQHFIFARNVSLKLIQHLSIHFSFFSPNTSRVFGLKGVIKLQNNPNEWKKKNLIGTHCRKFLHKKRGHSYF